MQKQTTSEENRLAVLYTLQAAHIGLTEEQLARVMSETSVMNFFALKSALHGLCEDGLAHANRSMQSEIYTVTEKGARMIESLRADLRHSTRSLIDAYLQANAQTLFNESAYSAGYTAVGNGQYRAHAQIMSDGIPIFELSLILDSREQANTFTAHWKEKGPDLYQRILVELTI